MVDVTGQIMGVIDADAGFTRTVENTVSTAKTSLESLSSSLAPSLSDLNVNLATLESNVTAFVNGFADSLANSIANIGQFENHVANQVNNLPDKLTMMTSSACASSSLGMPSLGTTTDFFGSLMDQGLGFAADLTSKLADITGSISSFASLSEQLAQEIASGQILLSAKLDEAIAGATDPSTVLSLQSLQADVMSDFRSMQSAGRTSIIDSVLAHIQGDSAIVSLKNELLTTVTSLNNVVASASEYVSDILTHSEVGTGIVIAEQDLHTQAIDFMTKASDASTLRSLFHTPDVSALMGYVATDDLLSLLGKKQ